MKIVTPKFQETIQDLIDNLQADQFLDAEEYKLAQKYQALPLGFDLLAYVFLTPEGEVIWEDFQDQVGRSSNLQGLIRVLVAGQWRYPQLAAFVPNRSAESKTCPICEGSGIWGKSKDSAGNPGRCFICAGLGWTTDEEYSEVIKNIK